MTRPDTGAVVVTYNPDIDLLDECLGHAAREVSALLIVDNGSANVADVRRLCVAHDATLVELGSNHGIARALNTGLENLSSLGMDFALLLDQDSVLRAGSVEALRSNTLQPAVGIATASVQERRTGTTQRGQVDVNYCISSGSLLRLSTWRDLEGYDEDMFIDFVDFDYCARLRIAGHRIVRSDRAAISHTIGRAEKRRLGVIYNYPPQRLEHMARDMVHFAIKHRRTPPGLRPPRTSPFGVAMVLARKTALILLYENNRLAKAGAIIRGAAYGVTRILTSSGLRRAVGGRS
ncbi:glycosyltransferase [Microbacterium rhizophilus]|uniref:glycosyltransferase n=1 Tax=Microbacterium rhizophilus TaxID=3138934 RepID=UPI0031EB84D8